MKVWFFLMAFICHLTLYAGNPDEFEQRTGLKGTYNVIEKVFKTSFPRTDIKVLVNESPLDPFMGLTSWAAFSPIDNRHCVVMGDLVLFEDEVNPVMSVLFENNLDVTALHNHFFFDQPKVYFMHIAGMESLEISSTAVKKALETVKLIRTKFPHINSRFDNSLSVQPLKSSLTPKPLESIFGMEGQTKDGMIKFVIGRKVKMNDVELGKDMGVNTWAAFGGSDENAIVDGDFATTEEELQRVLRVLRKGNINIVAIHNHMTMEKPRLIFLHYWGMGHAEKLAQTIKEALP